MTYEKMARAMRYYYKMKILEKVPHKRLHFRFGEKMLARVLDTNTVKPLRRMSTGDQHNSVLRPTNNKTYYNQPPPLQMLRRNSVDGLSLNSPGVISYPGGRLSDCPPTPMTPLTPLTPCTPMTPLTPCTPGVNRTPVICSRTTNVFFPPDVPLPTTTIVDRNTQHHLQEKQHSVIEKSPLALLRTEDENSESTTTASREDDASSDRGNISESDAELVVDID
jgi:Ets-domain.